jgi:hypothetical protein
MSLPLWIESVKTESHQYSPPQVTPEINSTREVALKEIETQLGVYRHASLLALLLTPIPVFFFCCFLHIFCFYRNEVHGN